MFNDEKDLIKSINELTSCLEKALEQEIDIEIISGELQITITKNKRGVTVPYPDDVKLPYMDNDLNDLHDFISSLPENV